MKVYISVDFEGVAGVVHWDQIMAGRGDYALGRELLMGELNAAIRGAMAAGAGDITVNDSHAQMRNVLPDQLIPEARLILGHFKPMYMMEGLDSSFDAVFFLAYHGAIGSAGALLSHTYSPGVVWEARIDGRVTGETGINALVANHYGVPVVLVTGDQQTAREAEDWVPGAKAVSVKKSCSRYASDSISPTKARDLIYESARDALTNLQAKRAPTQIDRSVTLELIFQLADMAELATWVKGVERTGDRSIRIVSSNGLEAYRAFYATLLLARTAADS